MKSKLINYFKSLTTKDYIVLFFTILLSLYLAYLLLFDPIIGKADNGDFSRMYKFIGITDLGSSYEEIYDGFLHKSYNITYPFFSVIWLSNWVFGAWMAKISLILNLLFNPVNYTPQFILMLIFCIAFITLGVNLILKTTQLWKKRLMAIIFFVISLNLAVFALTVFNKTLLFDIRFVGILYAIIFIIGVYLILSYKRLNNITRVILGIFILIFFTDICYVAYFNSFFGEGATISFLFLTLGSFLRLISKDKPVKLDFILFFFASFAFLTSKTQQLPLILFMILIYIGLFIYYSNFKRLIIALSICIISIGALQFTSICDHTNKNNIYQAVFTGILRDSPSPEADLIELGLDPKFAANAGPSFYGDNLTFDPLGDEMLTEFYPNISLGKVLKFYVTNIDRAFDKFVKAANNAYKFYPNSKTGFEKGVNFESKVVNTIRTDLTFKYPNIHKSFIIFFCFSLIYLLTLVFYFIKAKNKETKLLTLMLLFLLACGASQIVLPVIGSGEADFGKHLFLMNLAYDILIGTILAFLLVKISRLFQQTFNFSK
ncbi:MAG: hypothetical protein RR620_02510 [Clostridium sp.]